MEEGEGGKRKRKRMDKGSIGSALSYHRDLNGWERHFPLERQNSDVVLGSRAQGNVECWNFFSKFPISPKQ